jgi:hypothetical protein
LDLIDTRSLVGGASLEVLVLRAISLGAAAELLTFESSILNATSVSSMILCRDRFSVRMVTDFRSACTLYANQFSSGWHCSREPPRFQAARPQAPLVPAHFEAKDS